MWFFFSEVKTIVLFICKTKSRLRRRHCGLAHHFKTDPTESVALCFGYAKTLFWQRRHCGLARHFKTDPTKTVALCFGYAKTLFWQTDGRADEQDISLAKRRLSVFAYPKQRTMVSVGSVLKWCARPQCLRRRRDFVLQMNNTLVKAIVLFICSAVSKVSSRIQNRELRS
jgi:hypothetical protein